MSLLGLSAYVSSSSEEDDSSDEEEASKKVSSMDMVIIRHEIRIYVLGCHVLKFFGNGRNIMMTSFPLVLSSLYPN